MNIDSRGVHRGRCLAENCSCEAYERDPSATKNLCSYCDCAPAKHEKLGQKESSPEVLTGVYTVQDGILVESDESNDCNSGIFGDKSESSSLYLTEESLFQDIFEKNAESPLIKKSSPLSHSIQNASDVDAELPLPEDTLPPPPPPLKKTSKKTVNRPPVEIEELERRKTKILSLIPSSWPDKVNQAISANDKANTSAKNLIIRKVVDRLTEAGYTEAIDFNIAADILVEKYPIFKSDIVPGSKGVAAQLRKKLYNNNYENKSKNKKNPSSDEVPLHDDEETVKRLLFDEAQNHNPSIQKMKSYLGACRDLRKSDLDKNKSAPQHLKEYPALKLNELLLWEFEQTFDIKIEELNKRWLEALPKLNSYFEIINLDKDAATINVLLKIHNHFTRSNQKNVKCIIEIFEGNTTLASIKPTATEPPRLIGIGSKELPKLPLQIFIDEMPIFTGTAVNALIFLFVVYCMFSVKYPSSTKTVFLLIEAILFRDAISAEYKKKTSVVNFIQKLKLF